MFTTLLQEKNTTTLSHHSCKYRNTVLIKLLQIVIFSLTYRSRICILYVRLSHTSVFIWCIYAYLISISMLHSCTNTTTIMFQYLLYTTGAPPLWFHVCPMHNVSQFIKKKKTCSWLHSCSYPCFLGWPHKLKLLNSILTIANTTGTTTLFQLALPSSRLH